MRTYLTGLARLLLLPPALHHHHFFIDILTPSQTYALAVRTVQLLRKYVKAHHGQSGQVPKAIKGLGRVRSTSGKAGHPDYRYQPPVKTSSDVLGDRLSEQLCLFHVGFIR